MTIPLEITVNRPAVDVWKRVGKWCDVGEWLQVPCTITWGKDGELGAVRSVANEILVGKTDLSYTYTQPAQNGRPYNQYHGTLEAKPLTPTTVAHAGGYSVDGQLPDDEADGTHEVSCCKYLTTPAAVEDEGACCSATIVQGLERSLSL